MENDKSWKGFKTFIGVTLIILQVILMEIQHYNDINSSIESSLIHTIGLDYGLGYFIGRNFLLILGIIFLYWENKKMTNLIRTILIIIITILSLSILGY